MSATEGETQIEEIVAVDFRSNVVAPCGMCRELILDYSTQATAIVTSADVPVMRRIRARAGHLDPQNAPA